MSESQSTRTVIIQNKQGLHLRPADLLARLAYQFESNIEVENDGLSVNAKSVIDLATLGAGPGTELKLSATGTDAEKAVEAIAELIINFTDEDEEAVDTTESESSS
ncbi:MAG: phosphocarrier protein HPr [Blastopirellula sp.]|nr:MAG: phosphocarrier protein HPr [Blastopirellula sp.]